MSKEAEAPPAPVRAKGRLQVEDAHERSKDSSMVEMNMETMDGLDVFEGDYVVVKGKLKRTIVCAAILNEEVPTGSIAMNNVVRKNLRSKLADMVSVKPVDTVNAALVKLAAIDETVEGVTGDLREVFLLPYFSSYPGRPVKVGDLIACTGAMKEAWFKVTEVKAAVGGGDSDWGCVLTEQGPGMPAATEIVLEDKPISREEGEEELNAVGYSDIGGLGPQLRQIREMVELPIRHPKLFSTIGVKPPKGVLMHGPPGCGKTLIARAIANETGCWFFVINGPEIMSAKSGGSEKNLRDIFAKAAENAPAIIFIDEIDSIAPSRDKVQDEQLRRVVATLLTLMDGLKSSAHIMVIGATNRPNALDPALRRSGRFDSEITIGVPSRAGRKEILEILTRKQKLAEDVDLDKLAEVTHGYVGADLATLTMKAAVNTIRNHSMEVDLEAEELDATFLDSLEIRMEDFMAAVKLTPASSLREVVVEIPHVSFADIGGLEDVKRELKEMIEFPTKYPEYFESAGIQPPRGALFYGPPGCGKTLLAKAMASECQSNFISVKGPQLLTKWFGESEENVRSIFDKARQSSPCVLFFDELDSIAKARGGSMGDAGGSGDRVVNQLLTEMDGVGERKNVFIIGATNRPEIMDTAVLRPGRLDQLIYIPMPDFEARVAILHCTLRKCPVAADVDWEKLAADLDRFTGADIAGLCQMAVKINVRRRIAAAAAGEDTDGWTLTADDLEIAKNNTRRSVTDEALLEFAQQARALQDQLGMASTLTTREDEAATGRYRKEEAAADGADGDDDDFYD